jgi:hypothetical protein
VEIKSNNMEKEILQIQIALFFQSDFTGNYEEASLKLKKKLGESKVTQQLPLPIDAPSDIPRLILGYENFNLNVSKNRLDLFCKNIDLLKDIVNKIYNVLEEFSLSIGRIGFVKTIFVKKDIEELKKLLPETIRKKDIREITIRVNERKIIEEYECNNIESLSNGFVIKKEADAKEEKSEGIIIVRDINTLSEKIKENKFEKEKIEKLIDGFDVESNVFILYPDNNSKKL